MQTIQVEIRGAMKSVDIQTLNDLLRRKYVTNRTRLTIDGVECRVGDVADQLGTRRSSLILPVKEPPVAETPSNADGTESANGAEDADCAESPLGDAELEGTDPNEFTIPEGWAERYAKAGGFLRTKKGLILLGSGLAALLLVVLIAAIASRGGGEDLDRAEPVADVESADADPVAEDFDPFEENGESGTDGEIAVEEIVFDEPADASDQDLAASDDPFLDAAADDPDQDDPVFDAAADESEQAAAPSDPFGADADAPEDLFASEDDASAQDARDERARADYAVQFFDNDDWGFGPAAAGDALARMAGGSDDESEKEYVVTSAKGLEKALEKAGKNGGTIVLAANAQFYQVWNKIRLERDVTIRSKTGNPADVTIGVGVYDVAKSQFGSYHNFKNGSFSVGNAKLALENVTVKFCYNRKGPTPDGNDYYLFNVEPGGKLRLKNCVLDGDKIGGAIGVRASSSSASVVMDDTTLQLFDFAVFGLNSASIKIADCKIRDNETGLRVEDSASCDVSGTEFANSSLFACFIGKNGTGSVRNCKFAANETNFKIDSYAGRFEETDNKLGSDDKSRTGEE